MKYLSILILMFILPLTAFANEYDEEEQKPTTQTVIVKQTVTNTKGTALGIAAAQHQFDMGTYSWQGSAAVGGYGSEHALSIGLGKRKCKKCPMINGSIGVEDREIGFGAAVNFRF